MKKAFLISHWESNSCFPIHFLEEKYDILIAIDSGADCCIQNEIKPTLLLGDMDSISTAGKTFFSAIEKIRYPIHKDQTDGELAIRWCAENGYKKAVLFNDFRGRVDQIIGLISLFHYAKKLKLDLSIITATEYLFILPKKYKSDARTGRISLLPLTRKVTNVYTKGLAYPLQNETLHRFQTRGLSNQVCSKNIEIKYDKGSLLMVAEHEVRL